MSDIVEYETSESVAGLLQQLRERGWAHLDEHTSELAKWQISKPALVPRDGKTYWAVYAYLPNGSEAPFMEISLQQEEPLMAFLAVGLYIALQSKQPFYGCPEENVKVFVALACREIYDKLRKFDATMRSDVSHTKITEAQSQFLEALMDAERLMMVAGGASMFQPPKSDTYTPYRSNFTALTSPEAKLAEGPVVPLAVSQGLELSLLAMIDREKRFINLITMQQTILEEKNKRDKEKE